MWQLIDNGRPIGTYAEADLIRWSFEGRINPHHLIWRPGMSAALPAHLVPPFAAVFEAAPGTAFGPDRSMRWLLPVGRSGWAIAAGYLGLLSLLLVPAPLALICGVLGINDIHRHRGRHGLGRALFGVIAGSMGTLGLVVVVVAQRR